MFDTRRFAAAVLTPLAALLLSAVLVACGQSANRSEAAPAAEAPALADSTLEKATFGGGCFWCTESAFQDAAGVQAAVSGFSGGTKPNPTYDEVSSGQTEYAEVVEVTYDPDQITYEELLDIYWRSMDPTDAGGQFADRGPQYRPVIFYHDDEQKRLAEESKEELAENGPFEEPIVVKIEPFTGFYAAEEYHQDYYKKNPTRYKQYYEGSGRGPFLRRVWGERAKAEAKETSAGTASAGYKNFEKPSQEKLRAQLTPVQYRVTQEDGTERAFQNAYWDNKRAGIYVDVVSGEPLFSSTDKFKSGTGWPSFTRPLEPKLVVEKKDRSLGMVRTEVRSKYADSHLGHVFEDGPAPTGLRYCINSAALRFIPADKLEEEGYGEYAALFSKEQTASSK